MNRDDLFHAIRNEKKQRRPAPPSARASSERSDSMRDTTVPKDASPELRRLIRDAEVPEITPETSPETLGSEHGAGELQNGLVRG
jgi:hypothetical protein